MTKPKNQRKTKTRSDQSGASAPARFLGAGIESSIKPDESIHSSAHAPTTSKGRTDSKQSASSLNPRQERFIAEYLIESNATQAAIRAGYSPKTAGQQAHELLKKPEVQAAISAALEKTAQKLELTREAVLAQYRRLGFSDPRKFFDAYGQLKPIHELDDDTAAAVQGFEVEMRQLDGPDSRPVPVLKVKWADRKSALDSIMKAQGWNSAEKHEHTGKNGGAIETVTRVVLVPPKEKAETSVRPIEPRPEG